MKYLDPTSLKARNTITYRVLISLKSDKLAYFVKPAPADDCDGNRSYRRSSLELHTAVKKLQMSFEDFYIWWLKLLSASLRRFDFFFSTFNSCSQT